MNRFLGFFLAIDIISDFNDYGKFNLSSNLISELSIHLKVSWFDFYLNGWVLKKLNKNYVLLYTFHKLLLQY